MTQLTEREFAVLRDRLEQADAIAEVIEADYGVSIERTLDIVSELSEAEAPFPIGNLQLLEYRVLAECIEGATLLARSWEARRDGEITWSEFRRIKRAFASARAKLRDVSGLLIDEAPEG